jgi:hypothetical protein
LTSGIVVREVVIGVAHQTGDEDSDLRTIARTACTVRHSETELIGQIARSRARGRSWTEIGKALGVSRQAARQRYAGLLTSDTPAAREEAAGTAGTAMMEGDQQEAYSP